MDTAVNGETTEEVVQKDVDNNDVVRKKKKTEAEVEGGERGRWDNQVEFFLSCLGTVVGLVNVWRFPYLCYRHGGGAFLFAYSVMLASAGLPLYFLELAIGQYAGLGPNKLFGRIAPAFKGLGYGMVFVCFLIAIYYNLIIAWSLFYIFAGMQDPLPWVDCGNAHNDVTCYKVELAKSCEEGTNGTVSYFDNHCTAIQDICQHFNFTYVPSWDPDTNLTRCNNGTHDIPVAQVYKRTSPSEDYYQRVVLGLEEDTSWENFGSLKLELVLCLLLAWTLVCLCLIKGIQSSGKVVYFTALFPYVVLAILLGRVLTLPGPGAMNGLHFYLYPKWETLKSILVWSDATTQVFYSLGPSLGVHVMLSSYNRFTHNTHRDAVVIALANGLTSVFAGLVVFSIIGFMAHDQGVLVENVVASGPGLAFVTYPEAVARMPGSQVFSFMFFFMLILLGLDSQFAMTETIITAILDEWPHLRRSKSLVGIACCAGGFLLGVPMCANGGIYMFQLADWFSASWALLILSVVEIVLLMYVYGHRRVFGNVAEMGMQLPRFSKVYFLGTWVFLTPLALAFIVVVTWVRFTPCFYDDYVFPDWVQAIGWLMPTTTVAIVAAGGLLEYLRRPRPLGEMLRPTGKWGPQQQQGQLAKSRGGEGDDAGFEANKYVSGIVNEAYDPKV